MLDQNTDRMWYVIGAVIIGAAIILILNNTFPQLFASIGETFQGKTDEVTEITDGIMPNTRNVNLLGNITDDWASYSIPHSVRHYNKSFLLLSDLGLEAGDTITASGMYDFGEYTLSSRFMFTPDDFDPNDVTEINIVGDYISGSGTFVHTVVVPENVRYVTLLMNNQNYQNQGIDFTIKLKELKLEHGSIATPY